jgi:Rrf2 family protein
VIRFSLKSDYSIRAMLELAARDPEWVKIHDIVDSQGLPPDYVAALLGRLKGFGLVSSRRGPRGGYALGRPSTAITLTDIVMAVDGFVLEPPHGLRAIEPGIAAHLPALWGEVDTSIRDVLDHVTLADMLAGDFTGASSRTT